MTAHAKDPLKEVNELLDRSPLEFEKRMDALAAEIVHRNADGIEEKERSLANLMADTMALSDLMGRRRVLLEVEASGEAGQAMLRETEPDFGIIRFAATPLFPKVQFDEAFDDIVSREPKLAKNAEEIRKVYGAGGFALQRLPLDLSKRARLQLTVRIQEAIGKLFGRGVSVPKAAEVLSEIGGFSENYAATVFRTNVSRSYTAGRFKQLEDPEMRQTAPALMFVAVRDADTRPNHAAAHGLIAPVAHPVWDKYSPPLSWNCRCALRVVTRDTLSERGLLRRGQPQPFFPASFGKAGPDVGFAVSRPDRSIYG